MSGLTAAVVLSQAIYLASPSSPSSFQAALSDAQATNRPLLVLVGADWCPGCRTMKQSVLPGLARRGGLRSVSFTAVDADGQADVARQLMRGSSIPQLIAFSRTPDGQWHREQITGATSERDVQSLIARALRAQQPPPAGAASAIGN